MKNEIASFEEHKTTLERIFKGKLKDDTLLLLEKGELYFHYLFDGLNSIVFNIDEMKENGKETLVFSEKYNVDFIIIFFTKGLLFKTDEQEYKINNSQGFLVMNADFDIDINFNEEEQKSHHITFLCSKEIIKEKSPALYSSFFKNLNFKFFDEHHDLSMTRSTIHQTFNYLSSFKYDTQQHLLKSLFYIALEYIERQNNPLLSQQMAALPKEMLPIIISVQNHIIENIDQKFNSEELSELYGITTADLDVNFPIIFGCSINQYYQKHRVYRGRDLLVSKEMGPKEIAYHLGFSDLPHFSRSFKKEFGSSPREYLKSHSKK
ncbi:helix-turn-helix domain-containing protein [Flammeovirga kamogawensis]|uniref:Helix-turn-helix transcriptional regulator n=1 Tax=Flammeovirga kamogawensis TaxID=373891 RepID=A0ABX8H481_9BACT|nr:AraC family transcriptional regulator [Flammeovirga kamogawensis]MBB6461795.1 AraC-like DNA-binding protein [Flammeovirga kamogawensis]QWG10711.1 helix-turn-helix transcriptional regulator [Flammeovirga kamogawensis]TRX63813.1 helix-turn-helix transcriptional regulator [Flammeovirga kamogawensis]